jgi:serine/threonine-protein kinase
MVGRTFLGRYETLRPLGEGGMGRVYLARQIDLDRQVVVKVMHDHLAADRKFRERFQRELRVMARFQHPYVVALYDSTRLDLYDASAPDAEDLCIVMEYVRGITLDTLLHRNGRVSAPRVGRLLSQLCEALQAAHSQGIIHRDLKPANLMVVEPDTPYEKMKVMDFGLAKLIDSGGRTMHKVSETGSEFAVGTPGYISPEQVRGEDMDRRSDLYSVGVILFELLTGKLPFTGDETMDVLLAHAQTAPPGFAEVGASGLVAPAVEEVVMSCLAKQPAERPNSALELAERFEAALAADAPLSVPADTPYAATPRRHERVPEPEPTPPPAAAVEAEPGTLVHQLEAWMPEAIATFKLRGFVQDVGGDVVESVPGLIRVRLGARGSVYWSPGQGPLSWLGLGRRSPLIDMELRLERSSPHQQSLLRITVIMSSPDSGAAENPQWRARCNQVFCDLRAYLMGQAGAVTG